MTLAVLFVVTIMINCVLGIIVASAGSLAVWTFYIGQMVGLITAIGWYMGARLDDEHGQG